MIRDCTVLAVEGTQASGKTTLVHALTAHFRELGINVACTGEPARTSPYIEDIVLHDTGAFDLVTELDLYAAQLSAQLRAARHHALLITDKTVMNVPAYARLVLDGKDPQVAAILDALDALSAAWAPSTYDAVICTQDRFGQNDGGDRFRGKVMDLQGAVDQSVREACTDAGVRMFDLPTGLNTAGRVRWVADAVREHGLLRTT